MTSVPRWCSTRRTAIPRFRPASLPTVSSSTPACTTSTSPDSSWVRRSSPPRCSIRVAAAWPPSSCRTRCSSCCEMANGVLVDVEAAVNIVYGYDIRGEILGETGTVELAENSQIIVKRKGEYSGRVPHRLAGTLRRGPTTPNSRNGSTRSLPARRPARAHGTGTPRPWSPTPGARLARTGQRVTVSMREQPDLYRVRDRLRHRNRLRARRIHHGQDRSRSCDVPRGHVGRRRSTQGRRTRLSIPGALAPGGLLLLAPLSEGGRRRIVRCEKGVPGNRGENSDTGSGFQLGIRRRAGTAGTGPQLEAAAGDRR